MIFPCGGGFEYMCRSPRSRRRRRKGNPVPGGITGLPCSVLYRSLWREDLRAWSWRISTVRRRCQETAGEDTEGWKKLSGCYDLWIVEIVGDTVITCTYESWVVNKSSTKPHVQSHTTWWYYDSRKIKKTCWTEGKMSKTVPSASEQLMTQFLNRQKKKKNKKNFMAHFLRCFLNYFHCFVSLFFVWTEVVFDRTLKIVCPFASRLRTLVFDTKCASLPL
jgi:hypothetical protein